MAGPMLPRKRALTLAFFGILGLWSFFGGACASRLGTPVVLHATVVEIAYDAMHASQAALIENARVTVRIDYPAEFAGRTLTINLLRESQEDGLLRTRGNRIEFKIELRYLQRNQIVTEVDLIDCRLLSP
jgi:hypothetical protein